MKVLFIYVLLYFTVLKASSQTNAELSNLLAQNKLAEVVSKGENMSSNSMATVETYIFICRAYRLLNNWDKVEVNMQKAKTANNKWPDVYYEMGCYYEHIGVMELAKSNFLECIELSKSVQHYEAELGYSRILINEGFANEALSRLNLIKTNNLTPEYYRLMAIALCNTAQHEKAILNFQKLEGMPNAPVLTEEELLLKAFAYMKTDNFQNSLKTYFVLDQMKVENPAYLIDMANIYKSLKDYAKQAECLELYFKKGGKYSLSLLFEHGKVYYLLENYDKADSVFNVMSQEYPTVYFGNLWSARCILKQDHQGANEKALTLYLGVISKIGENTEKYKKDYIEANHFIAYYYFSTKPDLAKSKIYWNNILKVDPENDAAKQAIAAIEDN
ncbi:MAG: hypothetical protein KDC92_14395 [Bacteroidetes bacterium]|nr:hypothetical protein [Bacteroidota bacterium]